jgi:bacillolysin
MRSIQLTATAASCAVLASLAACTNEPTLSRAEQISQTVAALRVNDPTLRADWSEERGRVVLLGQLEQAGSGDASDVARRFLVARSIPRRSEGTDYALVVVSAEDDQSGWHHVTFNQTYRGVPVWGKEIVVHIDAGGVVTGVNGRYMPEATQLETRAGLDAADAVSLALASGGPGTARTPALAEPTLVVYEKDDVYRLAWMFTLPGTAADGGPAEWRFFVDAQTGQILDRSNRIRTVAAIGTGLDCDLVERPLNVFTENDVFLLDDVTRVSTGGSEIHTLVPGGEFSTDPDGSWLDTQLPVRDSQQAEATIHHWLGQSYDRLRALTGREGWDDAGLAIVAFAHFPDNNAFWSTDRQSVTFGASEGSTYRAFGCANDVIAHEFMHGVVAFTAALDDGLEADALNESFADIFAAMVDSGDWYMGEGVFQDGMHALRDLANPSAGEDPDHYDDITDEEHSASLITSHAFFLAGEGLRLTTPTGYDCDVSLGRTAAFQHFFHALDHFLTPGSDMHELADTVSFIAANNLAQGQPERADVFDEAFRRVGLSDGSRPLACAEPWILTAL